MDKHEMDKLYIAYWASLNGWLFHEFADNVIEPNVREAAKEKRKKLLLRFGITALFLIGLWTVQFFLSKR